MFPVPILLFTAPTIMAEHKSSWVTIMKKAAAWILGFMALLCSIALLSGSAEDRGFGLFFVLFFGVPAFFLWRSAARSTAAELALEEEAKRARLVELQQQVIDLAMNRQGMLTVTDVVADLDYPMERAETVLQSLDDGVRVNSTLTDEGIIVYEFREVIHRQGRLGRPGG